MAILFTRRFYNQIKVLFLSPLNEVIFLIIKELSIFMLLYQDSLFQLEMVNQELSTFQDRSLYSVQQFGSIFKYDYNFSNVLIDIQGSFWENFIADDEQDKIIGSIRMVTYTVLKSNCTINNYTTNWGLDDQKIFLDNLEDKCNPYNLQNLVKYMPSALEVSNRSLCLESNCTEFKKQYLLGNNFSPLIRSTVQNSIKTSSFGSYPQFGYIGQISFQDKSDFQQKLLNLYQNNWVLNTTTALSLQFNKYLDYYIINFNLIIERGHSFSYYLQQVNVRPAFSITWLVFNTTLIVSALFFLLKMLLEGSIQAKPTQILVICNNMIEIVFTIFCFTETALFGSSIQAKTSLGQSCKISDPNWQSNGNFRAINPCFDYLQVDVVRQIQDFRMISQSILLFFTPFNLFWIYSYIKGSDMSVKFVNMIYRSGIHFMKMLPIRLITLFCWSLAFFLVFRRNFFGYQTYSLALHSIIFWSIPTDPLLWERQANNTSQYANSIEILILMLLRFTYFLSIMSFTALTISAASDFEYDFRSKASEQNLESLSLNYKKLEKFQKSNLSENEQNKNDSGKLIAWWSKDIENSEQLIRQIDEELQQREIKVQSFINIADLMQFLKYLFQIKPQLLFKSQVYFRIIIDMTYSQIKNQKEYVVQEEKARDQLNIKRLLDMLKDKGCRVPLLLNVSERPTDGQLRVYHKIYPYVYINQGSEEYVKNFILKEDLKKGPVLRSEEDVQEIEDDESDLNQVN